MEKNIFFRMGQSIHKHRVAIIFVWVIALAASIPFLNDIMTPFTSTGFIVKNADSTKTQDSINTELGFLESKRLLVLFQSNSIRNTSSVFQKKVRYALRNLDNFSVPHEIIYPEKDTEQMSKDKRSAYAVVLLKTDEPLTPDELQKFKDLIRTPKNMKVEIGGKQVFVQGINKQTQTDLYKADAVAAPITTIVLIFVFGSLVAALIPLCLGGGCALIVLTSLYFIGHYFSLSIFTLNLALLLGLCLSLDYALFIIARFRTELKKHGTKKAIAITLSTAGRAVFFSGLAIFISLSALLMFPINILLSIGIGGLAAVFFSVMIAITLLPAVLSVLKNTINNYAVRKIDERNSKMKKAWRKVAKTVVNKPYGFLVGSLAILLLFGYPFLDARFGVSDFKIVPKQSDSRLFFDEFKKHFSENDLSPITVVVDTKYKSILSPRNISRLYTFTRKLEKNKSVARVDSIVTTSPKLSRSGYKRVYHSSMRYKDPKIKQLLKVTTGKQFTVIYVISKHGINAKETKALIEDIKTMNPGYGMSLRVAGIPVQNHDLMKCIKARFPYALLWVMSLTYLSLLLLLRSLFLPLKAIFMNVLSLSACFGVLVFIFQEGHFHQFLHFEPQGILDVTLVIIIFCAIFGFSMDYEVFLLSRIQEHFKKTGKNNLSIVYGIEQSNRIITSAALIVICLCGSFMVADVLMVKEFGLGIAIAIAVDAFIIRSVLVPSTMALLQSWNWYIPKWLDRLLP